MFAELFAALSRWLKMASDISFDGTDKAEVEKAAKLASLNFKVEGFLLV